MANGEQVQRVAKLAMASKPSVDFCGYRPEIKLRVISLPDLVRTLCLATVDQIKGVAISLLTIDGECLQVFGDGSDDAVDGVIPGRVLAFFAGSAADFPVNRARAEWRPVQCEALSEVTKLR